MENFRFILEPYNRYQRNRYTCPSCGKHREFTRYIDTQGAISFPEYVGKCNRINNCGYHYTPAMYFDEHPECKEYNKSFPVVKTRNLLYVIQDSLLYAGLPTHLLYQMKLCSRQ